MLHIFKLNGHHAAYDCTRRTFYPISALAMKILPGLEPPLTPDCPSSLRYAYAKYDSHDLSDAYAELYSLYEAGLLFAENKETAAAPAVVYHTLCTSAAAAKQKIETAAAAGHTHLRVILTDASPCLISSLSEAYSEKLDICFLADAPEGAYCGDAELYNRAHCYVKAAGMPFSAAVLALTDQGYRYVTADIPASDAAVKEVARLAKEMERRKKEGKEFFFAPFDFALSAEDGFDAARAGCSDCWAREICGGKRLDESGMPSPQCPIERTSIECAILLTEDTLL